MGTGSKAWVICAHCLCQEGQQELPLGSPDFMFQWLKEKADRLISLCDKLSYLQDVLGAQDPAALLRVLKTPSLEAIQWEVAELPAGLGGLAVPCLTIEAATARLGALLSLPRITATTPASQRWVTNDKGGTLCTTGALPSC